MAFVVKTVDLDNLDNETQEFKHDTLDISITFRSSSDKRFQKANELIQTRQAADAKALTSKPLDDKFFDDMNAEDKTASELWLHAIAKFLIVDWDVVDTKGDKLPVTGDNFVLLLTNVTDVNEFLSWCTSCAAQVGRMKDEQVAEVKKKPSRATSGKKSTQT